MAQATSTPSRFSLPGHAFFTIAITGLSAAAVVVQAEATLTNVSVLNVITLAVLVALLGLVHLQIVLLRWTGGRTVRRVLARLQGSAYISDMERLPNRNFMLAELRREMPRARRSDEPFTLAVVGPHDLAGVQRRRGDDFVARFTRALAGELRRRVRGSDFAAYLGESSVGVLLFECDREGADTFLDRMPRHIAVSDGNFMLDVPLEVRLQEYDMESIYATDVLRAVEESDPEVTFDPELHWSTLA